MKTFTAIVKTCVGKTHRTVTTEIRALNPSDAKWLLQAIFGFHAVLTSPTEVHESINKPLTPDQQRVKNLQIAQDRAKNALKDERDRQKRNKAFIALRNLSK